MSSTSNPGNTKDTHPTPAWAVRRFLEKADGLLSRKGPWLEPCAGDGAIVRAVRSYYEPEEGAFRQADRHGVEWRAIELRGPELVGERLSESVRDGVRGGEILHADVFSVEAANFIAGKMSDPHPSLVITNPPFALAEQLVRLFQTRWCLPTALLLPLNWLGSDARTDLWDEVGRPDLYVLPDRPSFTADGKTDSLYYAWMYWDTRDVPRTPTWTHLGSTPSAERAVDRVAQFGPRLRVAPGRIPAC